jgi:hypothetical protein
VFESLNEIDRVFESLNEIDRLFESQKEIHRVFESLNEIHRAFESALRFPLQFVFPFQVGSVSEFGCQSSSLAMSLSRPATDTSQTRHTGPRLARLCIVSLTTKVSPSWSSTGSRKHID